MAFKFYIVLLSEGAMNNMGIRFDTFNFIKEIIKIGITSILSVETTNDPSLVSFMMY